MPISTVTPQSGVDLTIKSYRRRKLDRIEEELSDLVRDLAKTTTSNTTCEHCGSYRAKNDEEDEALILLMETLAAIQRMKSEAWSND
jgi:CRISPR/Cas system-associated protein Cas10 (large subunit of type III CRISPR-Cas system)